MQRIVRKKERRAGENRAKSAFQNECQQLNLSAEQQDPVRAILEASNTKQLELRDQARESGSFGSMR